MLTIGEVAKYLKISPELVEAHIKAGRIQAADLNPGGRYRKIRISQENLDRFVSSCVLLGEGKTTSRATRRTESKSFF